MWLIVGLGNPGAEYDWTPHNLGFGVIERLAARAGIRVTRPEAQSYVGLGRIIGRDVALARPQTYMNASGAAVRDLLDRYQLSPGDLIVAVDEVALPWGMIRIRERGSAGTHNGMRSVVSALGSEEFLRVRLGVAPEFPVGDLAQYVLHPIPKGLRDSALAMLDDAAEAIELILTEGAARAMSRYNRRASEDAPAESEE